jgi:hypothetical protein
MAESHCALHWPPEQLAISCAICVMQTFEQLPQFWESVCLLVHDIPQRSGVVPPQLDVHPVPEHTPIGATHVLPHMPQLPFCERLSGHPLPVWAQSANPEAHWYEHFPPWHARPAALTFCSAVQSLPHEPQLCVSSGTHIPLHINPVHVDGASTVPSNPESAPSMAAPESPSDPASIPPSDPEPLLDPELELLLDPEPDPLLEPEPDPLLDPESLVSPGLGTSGALHAGAISNDAATRSRAASFMSQNPP